MTAAHASAREGLRSRVWTAVLAWAVRADNARTDFAVIGMFNLLFGGVLAVLPALSRSPALDVLMDTMPRTLWASWFLLSAALIYCALWSHGPRSGRFRHAAWVSTGTLGTCWLIGMIYAVPKGGNLIGVLFAALTVAVYTLTLLRLELPRLVRPTG